MPKEKPLYEINGERYQSLWQKMPAKIRKTWTLPLLQKYLQPWEVNYLLATMHEGVAQNGGSLSGLCCIFENLDATIAAWIDIGAVHIPAYLRLVSERAIALGSVGPDGPLRPDDGLPLEVYHEQLHTFADPLPEENMETVERLLYEYWNKRA